MTKKYSIVTKPNFLSKFYFNIIYHLVANLIKYRNLKVLDFGGGYGYLKKKLLKKGAEVKIYDIINELSDLDDYKSYKFDVIIFCQVLMYLNHKKIKNLFKDLKKNTLIISLFSTQTILSKILAYIFGHKNPHKNTLTMPNEEEELIRDNFKILKYKNYYLFKLILAIKN